MQSLPWGRKVEGLHLGKNKPQFASKTLRDEQVYLIHAIRTCCVDARNGPITERDTKQIFCLHYGYSTGTDKKSDLFNKLGMRGDDVYKTVAFFVNNQFFEAKAHFLYDKYSRKKGVLEYPANIEGE